MVSSLRLLKPTEACFGKDCLTARRGLHAGQLTSIRGINYEQLSIAQVDLNGYEKW